MRRGAINKAGLLFLLLFCFFNIACGQMQADKIKQHNDYANKAAAFRNQGDLQSAVEEQKKALELFPDNPDTLAVLAGMYLTLNEDKPSKENLENAKQLLEKATKINPNDAVSRKMYSATLELLGDKQGALREMESAVELQPENLDNLVNLAVIQKSVGDGKSAQENFEKALRKNPNYIYALYHYGEVEVENGNFEKAERLFKKAVDLERNEDRRDADLIEECRKRLAEIKNRKSKSATP